MNSNPLVGIGDFLMRPKFLGIDHTGVFLGAGMVFHNTPERGEHVSTVQEFSAGHPIRVQHTGANPATVIARVRKALANPKKYNLFFSNCEDSANEATHGKSKSPTVAIIVFLLLSGFIIWCFSRRRS
jgi:hypothetical protein